jgi:hypothetical protein
MVDFGSCSPRYPSYKCYVYGVTAPDLGTGCMYAGVAMGQYLSLSENPDHKRFKQSSTLCGLPGMLDPELWILFLNGAFSNTPFLRADAALLLPYATDEVHDSTECYMHWQSAEAVSQAEDMFVALHGDREQPRIVEGVRPFDICASVSKNIPFVCDVCSQLSSLCSRVFISPLTELV